MHKRIIVNRAADVDKIDIQGYEKSLNVLSADIKR